MVEWVQKHLARAGRRGLSGAGFAYSSVLLSCSTSRHPATPAHVNECLDSIQCVLTLVSLVLFFCLLSFAWPVSCVVCGVSRVSLSLSRVPALLHYTYVPVSLSLSCPVCVPSRARAPAVSLLVFVTDCDQRPIMRG